MNKLLCLLIFYAVLVNAAVRQYYIAADEVVWDYAPLNKDGTTGKPFNDTNIGIHGESPAMWVVNAPERIGKQYKKVLYREYVDNTFSVLKPRSIEWIHLGYLGPLIRAEVGDTIKVTFRNNANRDYTMHPHGVFYDKSNEGVDKMGMDMDMDMGMQMDGNSVKPGMEWTYIWEVPERAGPGPEDSSSILWMYHSHVDEPVDVNSGLVGPIIIARAGAVDSTGKPNDVDREFVVMFSIVDENLSWYLEENMMIYLSPMDNNSMTNLMADPEFQMSNKKHAVNGYLYANLPGLNMMINETVRWHVLTVGDEQDLHGTHWHGQTLLYEGHRVDVIELIPASMKTLDMIPDNAGTWLFHCHTNHHITAGMTSTFNVTLCPTACPRQNKAGSEVSAIASLYPSTFLIFVAAFYLF